MSTAIEHNNETNSWEINGQVFFDGERTFSDGNRDGAKTKQTGFSLIVHKAQRATGSEMLTDRGLGQLIGFCLGNGITWIQFSSCTVSVNYLSKALAFRAEHGWFRDMLMDSSDHKFDANVPTPGHHWGEGRQLQKDARDMAATNYSGNARAACRFDEADAYDAEIAQKRARAKELMFNAEVALA